MVEGYDCGCAGGCGVCPRQLSEEEVVVVVGQSTRGCSTSPTSPFKSHRQSGCAMKPPGAVGRHVAGGVEAREAILMKREWFDENARTGTVVSVAAILTGSVEVR